MQFGTCLVLVCAEALKGARIVTMIGAFMVIVIVDLFVDIDVGALSVLCSYKGVWM